MQGLRVWSWRSGRAWGLVCGRLGDLGAGVLWFPRQGSLGARGWGIHGGSRQGPRGKGIQGWGFSPRRGALGGC